MTATGKANQVRSHRQRLSRQATELVRKDARIKALDKENEELAALANGYHLELTRYRNALEELSRLGNGDQPGNSTGNLIAQRALKP